MPRIPRHRFANRRINLDTVKQLTGCATREEIFARVRQRRLPQPIKMDFTGTWWRYRDVLAAIERDKNESPPVA